MFRSILVLVAAVSFVARDVPANTLHVDAANPNCPGTGTVPDPYCSIQTAIAAAAAGDTVLVAPGTYAENLDFLGKAITVASSGGPAVTAVTAASGSVVTFRNGEGPRSVLEGFTLRGGDGTPLPPFNVLAGGGILCLGASPEIRQNVVELNRGEAGAGVHMGAGSGALVEDNVIRENGGPLAAGPIAIGGGVGIFDSSPVVRGNVIEGNLGIVGAGIAVEGASSPLVEDNVIRENGATSFGEGTGGGISCAGVNVVIRRNQVLANLAHEDGGGIICSCNGLISGNEIADNRAAPGSGLVLYGAATVEDNVVRGNGQPFGSYPLAAVVVYGSPTLRRNVIRDSVDASGVLYFGGAGTLEDSLVVNNDLDGVACVVPSAPVMRRVTITGNTWGVFADNGASPALRDSIVYGNQNAQILVANGSPDVRYCDVGGGFAGTGNIDANPLFVDAANGDYRLQPASPCRDAGDPASGACGLDVARLPRRLDGDLAGGMRVDMGAHEYGNVQITLTEGSAPGPSLVLEVSGTPGLMAFLLVGDATAADCIAPYGPFFLDLAAPFVVLPLGTTPFLGIAHGPLPPFLYPPRLLQVVGVLPGPGTGNVSRPVQLTGG